MKQFSVAVAKKLGYLLAGCVILLALLVLASRVIMPILDEHRMDIEQWASATLQAPVKIDSVRLSWFQYQPVISLNHVTVLDKQASHPIMQIKHVHIMFSIPRSLWRRSFVLSGIVVNGTDISLHQSKTGEIQVEGFPALGGYNSQPYSNESKLSDVMKWIAAEPRLILRDIDIRYTNSRGILRYVTLYDLRLENDSEMHKISGKAILHQDLPTEINVLIDWQGNAEDINRVKAKGYFYVTGFSLGQWLKGYAWHAWNIEHGTLAAKCWFSWEDHHFVNIQSQLAAYHLEFHAGTDKAVYKIDRLSGNFGWKNENGNQIVAGDDVLLDLSNHLWPATSFYVEIGSSAEGKWLPKKINIGYLNLADLRAPLVSLQMIPNEWDKKLLALQLSGSLEDAKIEFNGAASDFTTSVGEAQLVKISLAPIDTYPGIKNISAKVNWNGAEGQLHLQSVQSEFELNSVFLQPLSLDSIAGDVQWQKMPDHSFSVKLNQLQLDNADLKMQVNGVIIIPSTNNISTDLNANFSLAEASHVTRYLPMRTFSKDLVAWLQQAFLAGKVTHATATLRGQLQDYPFDKNNGEFRIGGQVENVKLRYAPDWPVLENLSGQLTFSGRQMVVEIEQGMTMNIPFKKVHAIIPSLGDEAQQILKVEAQPIATDMAAGVAYLHASPLENTIGKMFSSSKLSGPVELTLSLQVPLSHPDVTKVQGVIMIKDVMMNLLPWGLKLENMQGQLQFTESDTKANGIKGVLFSHPLLLNLQTINKNKTASIVRAAITAEASVADLEQWLKLPLAKYIQGQTQISGNIDFANDAPIVAHLTSDLVGMAITVPEKQYAKAAIVPRKLLTDIIVQDKQPIKLKLNYGNLLGAALVLDRKQDKFNINAVTLNLGSASPDWPKHPGWYLTGNIPLLNWETIKAYSNHTGIDNADKLDFKEIDVVIDKLVLPGQELQNTRVQLTPLTTGWHIDITNNEISGQITLPSKMISSSVITAQFEKLHLVTPTTSASNTIDVKSIPSINFTANNLSYNAMSFGQINFNTESSAKGLTIKSLTINSSRMALNARGEWVQKGAQYTTQLQGNAKSTNVSAFLSSLGFDVHNFIASNGKIDFKLSWQGVPYSPSLGTLNGNASIDLGKGRIVEVSQTSGAKMDLGKMLSIFSLQTIPRRLSFDFSDLFQKGYSYDFFRGDFNFTNGSAYTTNTHFDGPVAKVGINGRIGLAQKDFDFTLSVTPYVTNSIPVAATLITGQPLVGIAALAVSRVIGSEVSKVTTYYYVVRGPWSNPNWDSIKSPR